MSAHELHDFAQALGVRRLGFQGDHYDVRATVRERALDLGARPISSRELVSRLRASGLRHRSKVLPWDRAAQGIPIAEAMDVLQGLASAEQQEALVTLCGDARVDTFTRRGELALLCERSGVISAWSTASSALPNRHLSRSDAGVSTMEFFFDVPDAKRGPV